MAGVQSQADIGLGFKGADQAKDGVAARPTTAGIASTFGQSEAPTAASANALGSAKESQALLNARGISASRFSKFEENEKSV